MWFKIDKETFNKTFVTIHLIYIVNLNKKQMNITKVLVQEIKMLQKIINVMVWYYTTMDYGGYVGANQIKLL